MAILKPDFSEKPRIDLAGPQGNAYFLLGTAEDLAKADGRLEAEVEALMEEMRSGDYDNLIKVFDREFGDQVDLILPPETTPSRAAAPKRPSAK